MALFCWLLWGDAAWSMRERSVGPMAQWYLKHLEVSNLLFALLISTFPAAIGLLLGPIISLKSDRHRGKRGRRIPFLLVTTPIAAFAMIGIALCPMLGPKVDQWLVAGLDVSPGAQVCSLICFGVFWAAFEFATVTTYSVFSGLINDVVPRELLGRFYGLFRAVSLIDGMIFNYWLIGKVDTHFTVILVILGVFYGAGFMWMCYKVREGAYPPPSPRSPTADRGLAAGWMGGARTYFSECYSRPYYLGVFVFITLSTLTFVPVNTFMIPYARSLGMNMETYGKCLALSYLISLGLAYFLGWLADVFHPLRVTFATLAGYAAVAAWGALFARDANSFGVAVVLHCVLSGCYFTCVASLAQRLYPNTRFAQFSSAGGIIAALANMVAAPLIGIMIDQGGGAYQHTFTVGVVLAGAALLVGVYVHRRFMLLGGPSGYAAPE